MRPGPKPHSKKCSRQSQASELGVIVRVERSPLNIQLFDSHRVGYPRLDPRAHCPRVYATFTFQKTGGPNLTKSRRCLRHAQGAAYSPHGTYGTSSIATF